MAAPRPHRKRHSLKSIGADPLRVFVGDIDGCSKCGGNPTRHLFGRAWSLSAKVTYCGIAPTYLARILRLRTSVFISITRLTEAAAAS